MNLKQIEEILQRVEQNKKKLENDRQCYTCALGHCDESGTYCENAADDYDCEEEGCSNYKDGTPSYAKIDEDDLQTILDSLPVLLADNKRIQAELDAAKVDMSKIVIGADPCEFCKCNEEMDCRYPVSCPESGYYYWKWRGVKGE